MLRPGTERVLLIGDADRQLQGALTHGVPGVQVTSVESVFDGIAELSAGPFTTILAAAEPIERRPEAAVRAMRELVGTGRLVLFGHPTLELLSRKMMQFGADDYVITPAGPSELRQILLTPVSPMRLAEAEQQADEPTADADEQQADSDQATAAIRAIAILPLAELLIDAMLQTPHDATGAAVRSMNIRLASTGAQLTLVARGKDAPIPAPEQELLSTAVRAGADDAGILHLILPAGGDEHAARYSLTQVANLIGRVAALQDRHVRLQQMAITDELTGLYNGRYFRHFLSRIIEKARTLHFPVTLLLFDIDDFKKYNDQFGHAVGDEILRQTAKLMKLCTRQHDLVARIGGDEFAVVFWDKEGPRQPRDGKQGPPSRTPQTPVQIFKRFQQMIASDAFTALGASGKGLLGISAGLAVYPYEAQDVATLIREADRKLMFGAKQAGKNTLFIVGADDPIFPPSQAKP